MKLKVVGLICEYNPFHNGHKYHLEMTKKITNADVIITIITGYFSMRGDLSVLNKYDKTKIAIDEGANIVIELPYLLGTQSAKEFAYNAITLLNRMQVNEIIAGSELNDLEIIKKISEFEDSPQFENWIKTNLKKGYSYRKCFSLALNEFLNIELNSNDLLNLKYYDAIKKINPNIKLTLIQRINNDYLHKKINDTNIQSATSLRNAKDIYGYVPNYIYEIYKKNGFYNMEVFTKILKHSIITKNLHNVFQAKEGIENLFNQNFNSINQLIENSLSKRYKESRIKRFISYIITDTTLEDVEKATTSLIRILGFDTIGKSYLNKIKKEVSFFTNIKNDISHTADFELKIAKIMSNAFDIDFIKIEQKLPYIKE